MSTNFETLIGGTEDIRFQFSDSLGTNGWIDLTATEALGIAQMLIGRVQSLPKTGEAKHSPGWYRTMETLFAAAHFGAPIHPQVGEEWTALDGSGWTFSLTGTPWWEISRYADTEPA